MQFTSSAILLNDGYLNFTVPSADETHDLYYRSDTDDYKGLVTSSALGTLIGFEQTPATSLDPNPWTIAVAAPEPGTLTLSGLALLTLGMVGSRFRRGRAS